MPKENEVSKHEKATTISYFSGFNVSSEDFVSLMCFADGQLGGHRRVSLWTV